MSEQADADQLLDNDNKGRETVDSISVEVDIGLNNNKQDAGNLFLQKNKTKTCFLGSSLHHVRLERNDLAVCGVGFETVDLSYHPFSGESFTTIVN